MSLVGRLRNNLGMKLFSLLLAIIIWGVVHNQADPLVERRRTVMVEAVDVPPQLAVASIDPAEVMVTIRGRMSDFSRLDFSNFRLVASVAGTGVGVQSAQLKIEGLPSNLEIRQMSRTMARVELDAVITATRPVHISVRGRPAEGFTADAMTVRPNEATISGPSSHVQNVARVVAEVDLSGRSTSEAAQVTLVARDASSLPVSGVQIDPPVASVMVQLRQVNSKTVPVVPIIANAPAGLDIVSVTVKPTVVTLAGSAGALANTASVQTAPVDLHGVGSGRTYTVPLRLPSGLNTLGAASAQVTVVTAKAESPAATQGAPAEPSTPPATTGETPAPNEQPAPSPTPEPTRPETQPEPGPAAGSRSAPHPGSTHATGHEHPSTPARQGGGQ